MSAGPALASEETAMTLFRALLPRPGSKKKQLESDLGLSFDRST